jgi:2-dehydropantoate 2-reductase
VIVFGAGGIGGVVAAGLSCRELVVVTNNDTITQAIRTHGLSATMHDGRQLLRNPTVVTDAAEASGRFSIAVLAVPPNRLVDAANAAVPKLSDVGVVVPMANGLPEERLANANAAWANRIVGGIVGFGASMLGPGVVEQTSEGGIELGRLHPFAGDPAVARVAAMMTHVPTTMTDALRGARWSKLAVNCAISSLGTIGGDRVGALMRHRFVRRLSLEIITEVVQVAQAQGVVLEKAAGVLDLDWVTLDNSERGLELGSPALFAKHTLLLAVGARYRRLRSSMLAAIERGRPPPVDFLNGEVVERGASVGIATPVNEAVRDTVWRISRGEATSTMATLRALFDSTAHLRGAELKG